MKNHILFLFLLLHITSGNLSYAQNNDEKSAEGATVLFQNEDPLSIKLKFSIKNIKRNTNDSVYVKSMLFYQNESELWDSLKIKLRARGNFRRETCTYVPLKLKVKKSNSKGTLFEGNKKLKVVFPCSVSKTGNDYVLKEYLAYKLYEIVSPFHFKTRLVNIEFSQVKGQRIIQRDLKGILIEDLDLVAKRLEGREYKKSIHPLQHDAVASIQNNLFQYLIGNTDFSTRSQHNQKLLFIDKNFISIPYDFDMSGLVDASYATISGIDNSPIKITHVTQRLYKGYERDEMLFQEVRQDFINHKVEIFNAIENVEKLFYYPKQYAKAKQFIVDFFKIVENDDKFDRNIVSRARTR